MRHGQALLAWPVQGSLPQATHQSRSGYIAAELLGPVSKWTAASGTAAPPVVLCPLCVQKGVILEIDSEAQGILFLVMLFWAPKF